MVMGTEVMGTWDTWEELLLGGAVLRHGTRDWNVVAAELRARTICPYTFTPEVCKAKYEDLQQRYSGRTAWFEELKKKRVAELKKALELSEDSIGSLKSKLESLQADKNAEKDDCYVGNGSGGLESVPLEKSERTQSWTKVTSKDGLSAGSFTHETRANWSSECQARTMSNEEMETKHEVSQSSEQDKVSNMDRLAHAMYDGRGGSLRKRRGKRKRKDCSKSFKEASVGESDFVDSVDVVFQSKEKSMSNCGEIAKSIGEDDQTKSLKKDATEEFMEILNSIMESKGASAFRRRLDSQKRGRYKKMIRQHMDFDTLRSRISNQTIKSVKELFRDLLLLANNALIFYSKTTREYKSALLLREAVTKKLRENSKGSSTKLVSQANNPIKLPVNCPPVKPRSVRPGNRKIAAKAAGVSNSASGVSQGAKKPAKADSPSSVESLAVKKKGFGRPKKVGRGGASPPLKGKKRVRTR
ncbi:hypothetical protein L6164_032787 [Bauhinia variegata]|uniref:Uncharacterized protein n=1 Tax=Bauhinia variegata TaxID=167791 RepID=A0ACB9KPV8_BAUVA|nr:hypothetical protein L6164_032787 [Bauhinia variegata]